MINPCRWEMEGVWASEVKEWPDIYDVYIEKMEKMFGWNAENFHENMFRLLWIGLGMRFVVWISLYTANRSKQL